MKVTSPNPQRRRSHRILRSIGQWGICGLWTLLTSESRLRLPLVRDSGLPSSSVSSGLVRLGGRLRLLLPRSLVRRGRLRLALPMALCVGGSPSARVSSGLVRRGVAFSPRCTSRPIPRSGSRGRPPNVPDLRLRRLLARSCPSMYVHALACPFMHQHARSCPGMSIHALANPFMP